MIVILIWMCDSLLKLETLELRENMLKYLPSSLCRLIKLRSLDLGDNVLEELVSSSCCSSCGSSCSSSCGRTKRNIFLHPSAAELCNLNQEGAIC